jgi:hypothetical protein
MQEQLTNRLRELKAEFEAGQTKLAELESQANEVRTTMLRISGANQVLEEELAKASVSAPQGVSDPVPVQSYQPAHERAVCGDCGAKFRGQTCP